MLLVWQGLAGGNVRGTSILAGFYFETCIVPRGQCDNRKTGRWVRQVERKEEVRRVNNKLTTS